MNDYRLKHKYVNIRSLKWIVGLLLLFVSSPGWSQLDTTFWFVAPEVTAAHPNGSSPVRFNFATDDEPATVTISQPAGAGDMITLNIPANSAVSQTLDNQYFPLANLTFSLDNIENRPANTVLDKGFLIESTAPITAYYEINTQGNPDIFALKGTNAVGYEFYTPFQNKWSNANDAEDQNPNWNPAPKSAFDIVATEDNTAITITLPNNAAIVGHAAGSSFSITLNRGQTWSGEAVSGLNTAHPGGTHIIADKPIAVTVKDDSVFERDPDSGYGWCWDIMGDQLIPVEILGRQYVVTKGFLRDVDYEFTSHPPPIVSDVEADPVFIVATEPNTEIFIDGSPIPAATIGAGEQYMFLVSNPSAFIEASQPVYVLHTSGNGCEIGEAVLPPVDNCTGSRKVFFTRAQDETLYMLVTTKTEFINDFTINGNAALIPGTIFEEVPGSNGEWMTTLMTYGPGDNTIAVGEASVIDNAAGLFHFGFINGPTVGGGTRYGYFSSFNGVTLESSADLCVTDSVSIDAGSGSISYLWSTGETTQVINVSQAGDYWVVVNQGGCINTDTTTVVFSEPLNVDILTADSIICDGITTTLDATGNFVDYQWSTGAVTTSIDVNTSGTYSVTVTNSLGCSESDDIPVMVVDVPQAFVSIDDDVLCEGQSATITAGDYTSYLWSAGQNTSAIIVDWENPGTYDVTVTNEYDCQGTDQAIIAFEPLETPALEDDVFCPGETFPLDAGSGYTSYLWSTGENSQTIDLTVDGTYAVTVTNADNCQTTASMTLSFSNFGANVGLDSEDILCQGGSLTLSSNTFDTYQWSTGEQTRSIAVSAAGTYWVTVTDASGCNGGDTITVIEQTPPTPSFADAGFCPDSAITLDAGTGFVNYVWSTGATTQSITVSEANDYSVVIIDEHNCTGSGSMTLSEFILTGTGLTDEAICENETLVLDAKSQSSYLWSTGATTPTISPTEPGTYWVEYVDLNGCGGADTIDVVFLFVNELPDYTDRGICADSTLVLDAGPGYTVYAWSTGENTRSIGVDVPDNYSITVADANNCIQSKTYSIGAGAAPTAVFLNDFVCNNDPEPTIQVELTGLAPFKITYAIDDIIQIPVSGHRRNIFEFTAPINDTYEIVRIVDGNNCPNNGPDAYVDVYTDSVTADFRENPIIPGCDFVTIYFEDQSDGDVASYEWTFNGDQTSNEDHPHEEFGYHSEAEVQMIVTNPNGCTDTLTREINIKSLEEYFNDYFKEINVFTPGNEDGYNDLFDIDPEGYFDECIDLIIYNRWGTKVYESDETNPVNTWDGVSLTGDAPAGTYYYIGDVQNIGFTGHLTLIRE